MDILKEALDLRSELIRWRRALHRCPEIGLELPQTKAFVLQELTALGYTPNDLGKAGIVAEIGTGDTVLLRADMDGLPVEEEAGLEFSSKNGNFHGCGHDLHTAMLLGAAALGTRLESILPCRIRFYFQPGEEVLQGAQLGVQAGVCDGVARAYMLHVSVNTHLKSGTVILPPGGIVAPSADYFELEVKGKGSHGADPSSGVDSLSVAARILLGLQHLPAREIPSGERAALTVASLQGGNSYNVLPDHVRLQGSLRCYNEDLRRHLKQRVEEISISLSSAFRAEAQVSFPAACPTLYNSVPVRKAAEPILKTLFPDRLLVLDSPSGTAGSEDFAVISHAVPSLMLALAAGDPGVGLHHPQVVFDESCLPYGTAALLSLALEGAVDGIQ
ncbi:MAG: amidohydrolase [Clostridia bacterium]|nr:amidohydrolase [Clostridia bacterium]